MEEPGVLFRQYAASKMSEWPQFLWRELGILVIGGWRTGHGFYSCLVVLHCRKWCRRLRIVRLNDGLTSRLSQWQPRR
jgi:hypothetical protein